MKVTTMFCAPVGALGGMAKVAITVPWAASEIFVPVMVPARATLLMGALAGGQGGKKIIALENEAKVAQAKLLALLFRFAPQIFAEDENLARIGLE